VIKGEGRETLGKRSWCVLREPENHGGILEGKIGRPDPRNETFQWTRESCPTFWLEKNQVSGAGNISGALSTEESSPRREGRCVCQGGGGGVAEQTQVISETGSEGL